MSPALLSLIMSLVQLAIQDVPELIMAGKTIVTLLTSGADPTPDQMAQIDLAYQQVSAKLDAKLSADLGIPAPAVAEVPPTPSPATTA